ncbi:AraC-like DNA-binding protein [Variovorax sp. TBS-050B]|uniref:AraC family transcriptional regulator n=1 Tax=Variovorax sp. TBS-050B TaxID=2940551 RepID=UPI00247539E1|nr:AraC family transcriptional regulator [Variovorax sp. TBS-050B]MDH6590193.1 AraC-like DNA-binding protein [Variovorax sp. TBS-050B]
MPAAVPHRCRLLATPWPEVHGVATDSARRFARHSHAGHGIGLMDDGAQDSASGRGEVRAQAGDLIATNPGEVHDGRPLGGRSRRWRIAYLGPEVIASVAGAAAGAELVLAQPVIRGDALLRHALQQFFARLAQWNAMPHDAVALACEESLAQTCGLLLARHAAQAPPAEADGNVARVRERLADEMHAPPSLAALAETAGLSRYQLLRRFARAYGMPPHAWLLQQRAEQARRLIRDGAGLASAALAAGFADQSHMTRIFARQFGFTPGAWQRSAARRPSR